MNPNSTDNPIELKLHGAYNFKHQHERLKYVGKEGAWHQFEKIGKQGIWCQVLDSDLPMIEETTDKPNDATNVDDGLIDEILSWLALLEDSGDNIGRGNLLELISLVRQHDKPDICNMVEEAHKDAGNSTLVFDKPVSNTPIDNLLAEYTAEECDFTDLAWVNKVSLMYAQSMPDSQVRCLLYTLANNQSKPVSNREGLFNLVRGLLPDEIEDLISVNETYHLTDKIIDLCEQHFNQS